VRPVARFRDEAVVVAIRNPLRRCYPCVGRCRQWWRGRWVGAGGGEVLRVARAPLHLRPPSKRLQGRNCTAGAGAAVVGGFGAFGGAVVGVGASDPRLPGVVGG